MSLITSTVTEPATAASPPPLPPTAIRVGLALWVAATVIPVEPPELTLEFAPVPASTVEVRTSVAEATPTPALSPKLTWPVSSVRVGTVSVA